MYAYIHTYIHMYVHMYIRIRDKYKMYIIVFATCRTLVDKLHIIASSLIFPIMKMQSLTNTVQATVHCTYLFMYIPMYVHENIANCSCMRKNCIFAILYVAIYI